MNALWWAIVIVVAAGVVAPAFGLAGADVGAVWLGIAGPAVMAGLSWALTTRTWTRERSALLPLMLRAFAVKVAVVVTYVVVMVRVVDARPVPFLLSLSGTYLVTHLAEAYCLRRLMAG